MREDETISVLRLRDLRRMPVMVAYVEEERLQLHDLLAYSALASGAYGRYRLVAVFPTHPYEGDPEVLCLDGPRLSKHRNPPFDNGIEGKSARLCLYHQQDQPERRWLPKHGLIGLFDLGRIHLANEFEWRRSNRWPGEDAPHGNTPPAAPDPALAVEPISPPPFNLLRGDPSS